MEIKLLKIVTDLSEQLEEKLASTATYCVKLSNFKIIFHKKLSARYR